MTNEMTYSSLRNQIIKCLNLEMGGTSSVLYCSMQYPQTQNKRKFLEIQYLAQFIYV
jgi:hypothetical protein